jgi:hypothetical protein
MATYAFTTTDTTFSLTVGGIAQGTWPRTYKVDRTNHNWVSETLISLSLVEPYYTGTILASDTVTVNGDTIPGTRAAVFAELEDSVFYLSSPEGGYPYSEWVGLITQQFTSAPTATVIQNTLG